MSTIREIIRKVDKVRPNGFGNEVKVQWLAALDGKLALDVFCMDVSELHQFRYRCPEDLDKELLVGFPHEDLYENWLYAQIDNQNGEYNRYQNSMEMYNTCYENYKNWFLCCYQPEKGNMCSCGNLPTYYITAYALAVKHGFAGTVEQWLVSLKGDKGDKGDPGAKLRIGTVTTLPVGSQATAGIGGTAADPVLDLGIPQGQLVTLEQLLKDTPILLQEGVHYGAEYPEELAENQLFFIEVQEGA